MRRQLVPAIISMVIFTVLLGVVYPLVVTGVAQVAFKHQANGSIVEQNGKQVGSSLLAQSFTNATGNPIKKYFQARPSAASYDPTLSSGSNLGPLNPKLIAACLPVQKTDKDGNGVVDKKGNPVFETNADGSKVCDPNTAPQRAKAYRELNGLSKATKVPVDAVTASGSGLDPDISVANAAPGAAGGGRTWGSGGEGEQAHRGAHRRPPARDPRREDGQCSRPQPGARQLEPVSLRI